MMSYPKQVKRHESSLDIVWSDGSKTEISSIKLRSHCPCASCREKRGEGEHSRPIRKQVKKFPSAYCRTYRRRISSYKKY